MAAPIAHIFLALQILAGPLKDKFNEKEFILGTSFPDIRYLNVTTRENTHFKNVTLDQIKEETSSFKAGVLFHSFVDEQSEKFIIDNKIYLKLPKFRFITQSLKFAEDQILSDKFDSSKYSSYFDNIIEPEKAFGINDIEISKWHDYLKKYFNKNLTVKELLNNFFELNMSRASLLKKWLFTFYYSKRIEKTMNKIVKDKYMHAVLLNFYANFIINLKGSK